MIAGQMMALMALTVAQWLGHNLRTAQALVIIGSIGLMILPKRPRGPFAMLLGVACVVQIDLSWIPWRPTLRVAQFVEGLFA